MTRFPSAGIVAVCGWTEGGHTFVWADILRKTKRKPSLATPPPYFFFFRQTHAEGCPLACVVMTCLNTFIVTVLLHISVPLLCINRECHEDLPQHHYSDAYGTNAPFPICGRRNWIKREQSSLTCCRSSRVFLSQRRHESQSQQNGPGLTGLQKALPVAQVIAACSLMMEAA